MFAVQRPPVRGGHREIIEAFGREQNTYTSCIGLLWAVIDEANLSRTALARVQSINGGEEGRKSEERGRSFPQYHLTVFYCRCHEIEYPPNYSVSEGILYFYPHLSPTS